FQRIGLSATQRPLDEVARFLGGVEQSPVTSRQSPVGRRQSSVRSGTRSTDDRRLTTNDSRVARELEHEFSTPRAHARFRPVTIVDAGARKSLKLTIEVPVEDMARLTTADDIPSGPAAGGEARASIWSAIHPRL